MDDETLDDKALQIRMLRSPRGGYISANIYEAGRIVATNVGAGPVVESYWDRLVALANEIQGADLSEISDDEPIWLQGQVVDAIPMTEEMRTQIKSDFGL